MEEILELKFDQHSDLRNELLSTGNAELVEVRSQISVIWHTSLTIVLGVL